MIGAHAVTVYPDATLTGGADLSCLIDTLTINHGRDDTGSQPDSSSVSIDLTTDYDPLPAMVEIGSYLKVTTTTTTGGTFPRFLGRITDIALGWEDAGEATPDHGVGKLTAVGNLADLGRKVVGDAPFPQELDGSRVSRVLALAGITLDPLYSDPGTVQILPRDIDSQPALDVCQGTAASAGGVLWETASGLIRYADANHRKGTPSALTLDACDLFVTPTWRRTLEGLVNEVSIGYGVAAEGGEQPRYTATNDPSKARFGRYGYTVTTELAALADASAMGQLLLVRNSSPVWVMAALPVDTKGLDDARMDALLALDVHSLITLTGLPSVGAAPTSAVLWVEGWKETLTWGGHALELVVSGYCRTVPPPAWDAVDPSWVWGGTGWTEQRRNLCANPSFETAATYWGVNATYWTNAGATLTLDPGWTVAGRQSARVDCDGAASQQGVTYQFDAPGFVARPGTTYTVSATIRNVTGRPVAIKVRDTTNLINAPFSPTVAAGQTIRVSATITTGAAANPVVLVGIATDTTPGVSTFYVDAVLIEEAATPGAYFDGDTPDYPGADYAWTGAPGVSASTLIGLKELSRNLAPNPSAEGAGGWLSNNGALYPTAYDTAVKRSGTRSVRSSAQGSQIGANGSAFMSLYEVGGAPAPVTPGAVYTVSLWMRHNVAAPGVGRIAVGHTWLDANNATIGGAYYAAATTPAANTWARSTIVTVPAPANAAKIRGICSVSVPPGQLIAAADTGWVDDYMVTVGPALVDYFDGDTPDTDALAYAWTGPASGSPSTLSEVARTPGGVDPALTWDDLSCLGPPAYLGRWDDQPASLRWNQVSPTTSWDNYGG
jgi:hypothetical protein